MDEKSLVLLISYYNFSCVGVVVLHYDNDAVLHFLLQGCFCLPAGFQKMFFERLANRSNICFSIGLSRECKKICNI